MSENINVSIEEQQIKIEMSGAEQSSLGYTAENVANKGQNDGYASLDNTGKVPLAQLPSGLGGGASDTDELPEGSNNLYFTENRARSTLLTGLNLTVNAVISATDSVLTAFGKLQKQVSDNLTTLSGHISNVSNPHSVTKTQVGLGNVSNVDTSVTTNISDTAAKRFASDTEKTTWNNKQNALGYTPQDVSLKDQPNGYAGLDGTGKVSSSQLPAFVDDVLEFANLAGFPVTGETGKMYLALDTNKIYRWSGTVYVEIVSSPSSTDAVAEGSINLYFTTSRVLGTALSGLSMASGALITASDNVIQAFGKLQKQISDNLTSLTNHTLSTSNPHSVTKSQVGLGNVDNTSDTNKPISTATQTALDLKQNALGYTAENSANKNQNNGYAGLDGTGKINALQLPAIAITNRFVVASESEMLALTAETGDLAIRTDLSKTFVLGGSDPTVLADWTELESPTGAVSSVHGRTGAVTAQAGDYNAGQITNTPSGSISSTTVQAALNELDSEKASTSHTHGLDDLSDVVLSSLAATEILQWNGTNWVDAPLILPNGTYGDVSVNSGNFTVLKDLIAGKTAAEIAVGDNLLFSDVSDSNNLKKIAFGSFIANDPRRPCSYFQDFLSLGTGQNEPFIGTAISSGTFTMNTSLVNANHIGVANITSSTTANSGYRSMTDGLALVISGGETFWGTFQIAVTTNTTMRIGFFDTTTSTLPTDAACIDISGTTLQGRNSSNGSTSTTGTTYTVTTGTWYTVKVEVNADATSVTYRLFNESGTELWSASLSTNIPTGASRNTGAGMICTNSGTTNQTLAQLDYMSLSILRNLTR